MSATVQQAVAAVMAELPGIGKGDKSPEGYVYRGIEAVTKHVQPLLAKHGVVLVPSAEITDVRPSPAMKEGWTDVFMRVSWDIVGPDGSTLKAQTFGIGRDRADKGANKAMTQAFKYLLLDLLCISDAKDDSDGQTYEHDRHDTPAYPCNKCEFSTNERDAMREHLVSRHDFIRNDDGTVTAPKPVPEQEADDAPFDLEGPQAIAERMREKVAAGAPEDRKVAAAGGE